MQGATAEPTIFDSRKTESSTRSKDQLFDNEIKNKERVRGSSRRLIYIINSQLCFSVIQLGRPLKGLSNKKTHHH